MLAVKHFQDVRIENISNLIMIVELQIDGLCSSSDCQTLLNGQIDLTMSCK